MAGELTLLQGSIRAGSNLSFVERYSIHLHVLYLVAIHKYI